MNIQEITSPQNKFIKLAKSLNSSKGRKSSGLFLIEGHKVLQEALKRKIKLQYIFIAETGFEDSLESISLKEYQRNENIDGIIINKTPDRILKQISTTDTPSRVIAIAKQSTSKQSNEQENQKVTFSLYCEDIQDPGNLGSMIRSAFAAGVKNIYLSKACADIHNPKTVRSSMGAIFAGSIYSNASIITEGDCSLIKLENETRFSLENFQIIGSSSHTELNYKDLKLDKDKPILLMVGNEGKGLSEKSLQLCTSTVKIPMHNNIESLNALAATSVLLFHLRS